jgi:hypothetical protein
MKIYSTYGRTVNVKLDVYEECKYTAAKLGHTDVFENCMTVEYKGLKEWYIITGEDAEEIEAHTDGSCIDDHHEYLELHFEDGTVSTFRNSYVDMFEAR